jgi:hypothetical protein
MKEIVVSLVGSDGITRTGVFRYNDDEDDCVLVLALDGHEYQASGDDYFQALCSIREDLELLGLRPRCYGASLAAYPSGMCRDMGRGLKLYKLSMGRLARMTDLVGIFDAGEDVELATVAEQAVYYEKWLASFR